jgi:hypothetical protein
MVLEKGAHLSRKATAAMTAQIRLSNRVFQIGTTEADSARRSAFFTKKEGELTEEERKVLESLGMNIGDAMMDSLRPYLANFFDALPSCQTDTELYLKQECEIPYFVIWSILFGDYQETEKRLLEQRKRTEPASNINIAQSILAAKRLGVVPGVPAAPTVPTTVPTTVPSAPIAINEAATIPPAPTVPAAAEKAAAVPTKAEAPVPEEDLETRYLRAIQTLMLTHRLDVATEDSVRKLFTLLFV